MADEHHLVLICSGMDQPRDYARLMGALKHPRFHRTGGVPASEPKPLPSPERVCSVRHAQFAPFREVPLEQAVGRICARPVTPYPPGVPVIYPGERIDQVHIEFLIRECYTKLSIICIIDE